MKKVKNAVNKLRQGSTSTSGVKSSLPSISAPTVQPMPSAGMQNSILSRLVQSSKEIATDTTPILSLNSPQLAMFKQRMQSGTDRFALGTALIDGGSAIHQSRKGGADIWSLDDAKKWEPRFKDLMTLRTCATEEPGMADTDAWTEHSKAYNEYIDTITSDDVHDSRWERALLPVAERLQVSNTALANRLLAPSNGSKETPSTTTSTKKAARRGKSRLSESDVPPFPPLPGTAL